MLFKNAFVYRITGPGFSMDDVETQLQNNVFKSCSGIRPSSFGWISPLGDPEGPLLHEVAGSILLCAKREHKIVPGSALADVLAEKVSRLEQLENRKIRMAEKQRLKEDALAELLPRALPRSRQIQGYITAAEDLLVIDTSSAPEAELFINCLRDSLGTFSVVPPQVKSNPADLFTHWLNTRNLPEYFSLGDACDLLDQESGGTINCRKVDLATQEIRYHIEAGKICTRLKLRWYGDLSLIVDRDLVLRQIKLESSEEKKDVEEDPIGRLDAAFAIMTLELRRFLPALFSALGGETRD